MYGLSYVAGNNEEVQRSVFVLQALHGVVTDSFLKERGTTATKGYTRGVSRRVSQVSRNHSAYHNSTNTLQ